MNKRRKKFIIELFVIIIMFVGLILSIESLIGIYGNNVVKEITWDNFEQSIVVIKSGLAIFGSYSVVMLVKEYKNSKK